MFRRKLAEAAGVKLPSLILAILLFLAPEAGAAQSLRLQLSGLRVRPIEAASLFHTLFSDFSAERDGTVYVETGDIPAMWLRDSSAQGMPYLRFSPFYPAISRRLNGVIQRNARNVLVDPYANAFTVAYHVWERKWEIDSLAWPAVFAWQYWTQTHDRALFTPVLRAALRAVVKTYACQQRHDRCAAYSYRYTTHSHDAYNAETGMIWGAFRPSDDAVAYRFNIPQQALVVVALADLAALARDGYGDERLAQSAESIGERVQVGIERYGIVSRSDGRGSMY
ncbi:MAG: glycoside hydrolase family 125 protein, partial [Candidatus Eremiobacteraeota bacterium]|nr:glycoside hydrolase family 125 protein [Candidatus Eremiobacteraeota bacterium]